MIVEDEKDWQEIYLRNSQPLHSGAIRATVNLDEARTTIEEMAFSVAFVDIRLDEDDNENTDGLRVLELLRKTKDHTSAIMVTGKGTVGITRDALKEFGAYEALAKAEVEPQRIQTLIAEGTEARNQLARVEDPVAPEVLRGRRTVWDWDSEMLEATGGKGGVEVLYQLAEYLANPLLPLVRGDDSDLMRRQEGSGLAMGAFWSRAIGQAVVIGFGQAESMRAAIDGGEFARFAGHPVGEVLRSRDKAGLAGAVMAQDRPRSTFS